MNIGKLAMSIASKYDKEPSSVMQDLIKTESVIYKQQQFKQDLGFNDHSYFYLSASTLIYKYKHGGNE